MGAAEEARADQRAGHRRREAEEQRDAGAEQRLARALRNLERLLAVERELLGGEEDVGGAVAEAREHELGLGLRELGVRVEARDERVAVDRAAVTDGVARGVEEVLGLDLRRVLRLEVLVDQTDL